MRDDGSGPKRPRNLDGYPNLDRPEKFSEEALTIEVERIDTRQAGLIVKLSDDPLHWLAEKLGISDTAWLEEQSVAVGRAKGIEHKLILFTYPQGWLYYRDPKIYSDGERGKARFGWAKKPQGIYPLWPHPDPEKSYRTIWLTEGHTDCLKLRWLGFDAFTFGGYQMIPGEKELRTLRHGFGVERAMICFDADSAGATGAEKMAVALLAGGIQPIILDLRPTIEQRPALAQSYAKDILDVARSLTQPDAIKFFQDLASTAQAVLLEPIGISQVLQAESPHWLVEGILGAGLLTLLFGDYKQGKTTFIYQMMAALGPHLGKQQPNQFLGQAVPQPSKILFYSEMPDILDREYTEQFIFSKYSPQVADTYLFRRSPSHDALRGKDWPEIFSVLALDAERYHVDLIVIDTVSEWLQFKDADELNSGPAVRAKLHPLMALRDKTGAAVVLSHHTPKGGDSPAGSGQLGAVADMLMLIKQEQGITRLSMSGRLRGRLKQITFEYDEGANCYHLFDQSDLEQEAKAERANIEEWVLRLVPYAPSAITVKELANEDALAGFNPRSISNVLAALVRQNVLLVTPTKPACYSKPRPPEKLAVGS